MLTRATEAVAERQKKIYTFARRIKVTFMFRQSTRLISALSGNQAVKASCTKYTVIGVPTKPPPAATTVKDGKIPGKKTSEDVPHEWKDIKGVMEGEKKHGGERKGRGEPRGVVENAQETMEEAKKQAHDVLKEAEEVSKEVFKSAKQKLKKMVFSK